MLGQTIYIAPEVLKWPYDNVSVSSIDEKLWKNQYEIWAHAEHILNQSATEHDRACAIFQMSRAVDFREKHLNSIYNFRRIKYLPSKCQHEIMEGFGIVKPLMRRKLDDIRNAVMHREAVVVPNQMVCCELLEFSWYFLKSTDRLASEVNYSYDLVNGNANQLNENNGKYYMLMFSVDTKEWSFNVMGSLPQSLVFESGENNSVAIRTSKIHPKSNDESVKFAGTLLPQKSTFLDLVKMYFSVLR